MTEAEQGEEERCDERCHAEAKEERAGREAKEAGGDRGSKAQTRTMLLSHSTLQRNEAAAKGEGGGARERGG